MNNILLIGLRGSGKTTIGRELAASLRKPFVDLDDHTARHLGAPSVAEAWKEHGESGFRNAEAQVLRRVLATPGQVIALGGGTPTAPDAFHLIETAQKQDKILVIYLRASSKTLRERLAQADNSNRPSLTGDDVITEVDRVLAARDSKYRELADEVVDVDGLTQRTVLRNVKDRL